MKTNKLDIEQALFKNAVINKLAIVDYVKELEKENQELKGKIALQQSSYEKEFRELNDKLLKVVESVIDTKNEFGEALSNYWKNRILQGIKSAMEKENE